MGYADLLAAKDDGIIITVPDLRNGTVRGHCPQLSDLPIVDSSRENFYAARFYQQEGHDIPELSCNGNQVDPKSGSKSSSPGGTPIGTLYVLAGCIFYGFTEENFQGDYIQYDGPVFISKLPNGVFDNDNCRRSGTACPLSYLFDCRMKMPDCVAEDKWSTVASYDNTGSSLVSTFTYTYTIGTAWSTEMSQGFDVSISVTNEIKASFWDIFEETLGVSVTTGYDWSETSTQAQNEERQFTVETQVPGGIAIQIQQAKGTCGNSDVKTEMFRTLETKKNGEVTSSIFFH